MACFFRSDLDHDRPDSASGGLARANRHRGIFRIHSQPQWRLTCLRSVPPMISVISVRPVGTVDDDDRSTIPNRQQTNRPKTLSPQPTPLSLPPTLPPVSPTLPFPLPNTPLIRPDPRDTEKPASVLPRSAQTPSSNWLTPHGTLPFVYSPCSPHTPLAALPNCLHNPLPCALAFRRWVRSLR